MHREVIACGSSVADPSRPYAMGIEREAKLPVNNDYILPNLNEIIPGTSANDCGPRVLSSTYWDTQDLSLVRARIGLRFRSQGDSVTGTWTFKRALRTRGPTSIREEVELPGQPWAPPHGLLLRVQAAVGDRTLTPVVRLQITRQAVEIVDAAGIRLLEVVDDWSTVIALDGRRVHSFREIEVEAFAPSHMNLISRVVNRLLESGTSPPDPTPKYIRALCALGRNMPTKHPHKGGQ